MQSRLDLGNLKRGYKKWACIETRTKHLTCIETRPNKKASMRRCVYARYRLITLRKNYEKIRNLLKGTLSSTVPTSACTVQLFGGQS